jgi:hypothetical protein
MFLYKLLLNRLDNCKIYIIYGDETLSTDYEIIEDTYLVLKCGDLYDNLSQKTICLFKTIEKIHPDIKGVFKCDDDILPNIIMLNYLFKFILHRSLLGCPIPYLGFVIKHDSDFYCHDNIYKYSNEKYKKGLLVRSGKYTAGPLYYINNESIRIINRMSEVNAILKDPIDYMFEDNMVGYLLNKNNITPFYYNIYYDDIKDYSQGCIQNVDNKIRKLYVYLHGGLGNQLFQVAAGFEIAKKNDRFLVLVYRSNSMTHNKSLTEFLSTIFSKFNYIAWDDMNFDNVIRMHEDNCFDYYGSNFKSSDYDYYLNGYFQNKKYLNTYRQELLDIFCGYRDEYLQKKSIFIHYSRIHISYFIHIRRGDYVGHPLYILDLDQYLKLAISYILEINPEQIPHFYILSDDIEFCKTYSILDTIENTIIEDMDTLDSFYFMSLCRKGGICSNSTFSGWASMLNDNPDKTVIVPKNWINVDYPYEIPFDFTVSF